MTTWIYHDLDSAVGYTLGLMSGVGETTVRFQVASDQSLLVYFEGKRKKSRKTPDGPARAEPPQSLQRTEPQQNLITLEAHNQVRRLLRLLELEPIAGIRNLHPAYSSLLVKFDLMKFQHDELEEALRGYIARMEKIALPEPRLMEIPVCYGGDFGPDLKSVADLHGLGPERVIELHAETTYIVYFLGFAPGFAYLGELTGELVTPRLGSPRKCVPAGSVGIAGRQTGVYPISTPGGWRLLGRTPLAMFRADRAEMNLLSIGDRVRFVPILREEFAVLERK